MTLYAEGTLYPLFAGDPAYGFLAVSFFKYRAKEYVTL